jgi:hypothetical protein
MASARYADLLKARQDAGFEMFPIGVYDVKVVQAETPEKKSDRRTFIIQFEVLNGPLAGRKFKHWMRLIEEYPGLIAIWFAEMAAMGLGDAFFAAEPSDEQVCAALKDRLATVKVGRRKKKGTDEDVEDIRVTAPSSTVASVAPPAPDPMAAPATTSVPAADPAAPGLPPF